MNKMILILLSLGLASCSNPFGDSKSNVDTNFGADVTVQPTQSGYEAVSASHRALSTANGTHKVDLSVGNSTSAVRLKTIKNKTVYISVQGQTVSN